MRTLLVILLTVVVECSLGTGLQNIRINTLSRNKREQDCGPGKYSIEERCCVNCDAGEFVEHYCNEENGKSTCKPCVEGKEYMAQPSGYTECIRCTTCDAGHGQTESSPCTVTQNAKCKCQENFFCNKTQHMSCTKCLHCTKCEHGDAEACTQEKDTICKDNRSHIAAVVILCIIGVLITLTCVYLWKDRILMICRNKSRQPEIRKFTKVEYVDEEMGAVQGGSSKFEQSHERSLNFVKYETRHKNKRVEFFSESEVNGPVNGTNESNMNANGVTNTMQISVLFPSMQISVLFLSMQVSVLFLSMKVYVLFASMQDSVLFPYMQLCPPDLKDMCFFLHLDIDLQPFLAVFADQMQLKDVLYCVRTLSKQSSKIEDINSNSNAGEKKYQLLKLWYFEHGITGAFKVLLETLANHGNTRTAEVLIQTVKEQNKLPVAAQ
ncbi:tumor necrosis factor receptor superfamily member 6 [Pelobates fuscus]|uniref:tumor necrosis factor receptor superfamily member 6 n=1 Tax=Pelobates fuscus TaxID=191477 RepID=UPI002FE45FE5